MKSFYLFISLLILTSCTVLLNKKHGHLSLRKLEQEPWFFCNTDSLWSYDSEGNSILCKDYNNVKRLRVNNILGEIYFKGSNDLFCMETDSIILGKTVRVTASSLKNMFIPIDSFPNLQVIDLSNHHFFKFPFEIFQIPKLTALNIYNLCLHDYCEPCLYVNDSFLRFDSKSEKQPYVDSADFDKYFLTNLKPYYDKIRQIKFIRHDRYHHPDDFALIDSINKKNNIEKHWKVFQCEHNMCDFDKYDETSEESRLKVEIIYE